MYGFITGTMMDLADAYFSCSNEREALAEFIKENEEKLKTLN